MNTSTLAFMRELECEFSRVTGLPNRSFYKIYYCQVHPAPILTLGFNPGGNPQETSTDGMVGANGLKASASPSFFENGEHDILDCDWRENNGLRQLLFPFVANDPARFREEIVKTNLVFRRTKKKTDLNVQQAILETAPFLQRIMECVSPRLILLTGVNIDDFANLFASSSSPLVEKEVDPGVKQVVFNATKVKFNFPSPVTTVVQVAHASQFSWTYARYTVCERISELLKS